MATSGPLAKPTPWWRGYTEAFLDLVYTRKCEGCEVFLPAQRQDEARWLCDSCLNTVQRIEPPFCEVCGEAYDGAISGTFRCGNCTGLKLHFDFAVAACQAEGVVRELIHKFKYNRRLHLRGVLGCLLGRTMEDTRLAALNPAEWALVPVPLHHARQRERDYNQSMELCRELSRISSIPVMDALRRTRSTTAQASLSRHQRIENLRGAFQVRSSLVQRGTLKDRALLLVDDVLTTGSTTSECARVLRREAGVQKVGTMHLRKAHPPRGKRHLSGRTYSGVEFIPNGNAPAPRKAIPSIPHHGNNRQGESCRMVSIAVNNRANTGRGCKRQCQIKRMN